MLSTGSGVQYPWLKRKIARAVDFIRNWIEECDSQVYASISGGKDSLVMAHLIRRVYINCPLVWVNQGLLAEWDDCVELIEYLKTQGWNIVELCPVRDLWHLYIDYGVPLEGTMDTKADKIINQKLIYDPLQEYQELNDVRGYAWGIRRQESRNRAFYLNKYGEVHRLKNGLLCCSPIAYWTIQEVWQYIDMFSLKYPAIYDVDKMTVRNGCPIGTTGANWGRVAELKKHYPDIYNQFVSKFPQVSNYV